MMISIYLKLRWLEEVKRREREAQKYKKKLPHAKMEQQQKTKVQAIRSTQTALKKIKTPKDPVPY